MEDKKCPNCGKPVVQQFRPFCSAHCSEVDLGRWLGGRYTVPVMDSESTEDRQPKTDD